MGFLKNLFGNNKTENINEAIDAFKEKEKEKSNSSGEGYESIIDSAGFISRNFDTRFLYYTINNKIERIKEYRKIALNSEVSSVIEDACIEMTTENSEGKIFQIEVKDDKLNNKENVKKNLLIEFNEFITLLDLEDKIYSYFEDYLIDGEIFFENIINEKNTKSGILK
jgi:stress-induced morphogen